MTAYFDQMATRLHGIDLRGEPAGVAAALESVDRDVVHDVTICAEFPGFPEILRDRIARIVLQRSSAGLPCNAPSHNFDTPEEHAHSLSEMIGDLHTVFHDVAMARVDGFSDDPRTPLRFLYAKAEARRERIVADVPYGTICTHCNDTHLMPLGDRHVACTRCPVPCHECRSRPPPGPFCATTPCACACHSDSWQYRAAHQRTHAQ